NTPPAKNSGLDLLDGEDTVVRAGDAAALRLLDHPVVGEATPPQGSFQGCRPEVARLRRAPAPERSQIVVVDQPELPLVDPLPGGQLLSPDSVDTASEDVQRVVDLHVGRGHQP